MTYTMPELRLIGQADTVVLGSNDSTDTFDHKNNEGTTKAQHLRSYDASLLLDAEW